MAEGHGGTVTRPLRVLHVLHTFITGGMERGLTHVINHGSGKIEHVLCCLTRSGEMEKLLPPGTRVVAMGKPPGNSVRFLWRLGRALKELAPDVVHTRNWSGYDGVIAARLAGLRRVVHGEHGWDMNDAAGTNRKRRAIRRFLQRWVREYTCVSRDIASWLERDVGIRRRITQIYNGVDTDAMRPGDGAAVREELGLSGASFVAGIVGRLDPIKDHPSLFRASAAVAAEVPGFRLVVAGEGPEGERLRRLAGPEVVFLGNRPDVPRILRALDLFVLTSHNEGISNTILEAMASALPVLATRVGGNPEPVDDGRTGTLVPPGAPDVLAPALLRYVRDRDLGHAHGASGRADALERFSIRRMVEEYEQVWLRVGARA